MSVSVKALSPAAVERFWQQGYLILPGLLDHPDLEHLQQQSRRLLSEPQPPWELESATGYPGAPVSDQSPGGLTVRRLLNMFNRDEQMADWARSPALTGVLRQLFGSDKLWLNPNHHNCLMTKEPRYSSDTGWHQDIRYWHFSSPDLITAWTAFGPENADNGSLSIIPGSHRMSFHVGQFDQQLFLRDDIAENQTLLEQEQSLQLAAGDVLFFHCRLLHRATRNYSQTAKRALVFTYHSDSTAPLPGTRSAQLPEITL